MEELGRITKNKDVSLQTKVRLIHTLVSQLQRMDTKVCTVKKDNRKEINSFEMWC